MRHNGQNGWIGRDEPSRATAMNQTIPCMARRLACRSVLLAAALGSAAATPTGGGFAARVVATYKPDAALEGMAPGPAGSVIITSNFDRMLLRLDAGGRLAPFAKLPAYPQVIVATDDGFLVTAHDRLPFPAGKMPPPPKRGGPPPAMPPFDHLGTRLLVLDASGQVKTMIAGPDGAFFNGLARDGSLVLIADSTGGRIWRADLAGQRVTPWLTDPLLAPAAPMPFPGANGMKIHGGKVYVSNTTRGAIYRIGIEADGKPQGGLVLVTHIPFPDDFDITRDGTIIAPAGGGIATIRADGAVQAGTVGQCEGCDTALLRPDGSVLLATHGAGMGRLIEARASH